MPNILQSDELECQRQLRTEVIQLEDQLAQVRREYEMLRIEFEQSLAANEQTGNVFTIPTDRSFAKYYHFCKLICSPFSEMNKVCDSV